MVMIRLIIVRNSSYIQFLYGSLGDENLCHVTLLPIKI